MTYESAKQLRVGDLVSRKGEPLDILNISPGRNSSGNLDFILHVVETGLGKGVLGEGFWVRSSSESVMMP